MKSKTKIAKQTKRKTDSSLIETIRVAKKHKSWFSIAEMLSGPRRNRTTINLDKIKEDVVISGKVLSQGEAGKNKIVALNFSKKAKEKIIKAGGKAINMLDEIKENPEMKGLKILKKEENKK